MIVALRHYWLKLIECSGSHEHYQYAKPNLDRPDGCSTNSKGLADMSTDSYDFLVFIGRFQPFHKGHLAVIEAGLGRADQLIILCGSAHQPRSTRNPWTVEEREAMIRSTISEADNKRIHIAPLMDIVYNDEAWVRNIQATINGLVTAHHSTPHNAPKVGLIGHNKDQSSYYLNLFPQWGGVNVSNYRGISATPIREAILIAKGDKDVFIGSDKAKAVLPQAVHKYMEAFCQTDVFESVKNEQAFVARYKSAWEAAPYVPTFVTVDAVVVQSGHVLMVERKAQPGKGLLALPGGFVDQGEKLVDACVVVH